MANNPETLNIFSLNARGLGDKKKRQAVFNWLNDKGPGIFLIQEAHSCPEKENEWRSMWNGVIKFSHGTSNSRGLAVLISSGFDINITKTVTDNDGRFLILTCTVSDLNLTFVNIYAPTIDKRSEQVAFANSICETLSNYKEENIILGGDLNINLDTYATDGLYSKNPGYRKALLSLMDSHDLVDIWRIQHPDILRYTRREKTKSGLKQSRLDYFLIPCNMGYITTHTDIKPSIKSDHSLLHIRLALLGQQRRGKGFWKLNVKLLSDKKYIELIKNVIKDSISDAKNLTQDSLIWDFIKCRIRSESISYSIAKRKMERQEIESLTKHLSELEEIISTSPTTESLDEYSLIKTQLNGHYEELAKGSIIRSRCQQIHESEKPTQYFFNLEKANYNIKHIRSLKHNDEYISDPQKILDLQKRYFSKIYTETIHDSEKLQSETNFYLNKINIPSISEDSKFSCDLPISLEEVKTAVQSMANNKSPGPDGIPTEFYKTFWPDIGESVYRSFTLAYELGKLCGSQKQGVITLIPKKDKDLTDLKSWRPLSILNTDYKIIAKVLSTRLKSVLKEIINPDQVGYMKERLCGENTRLISDVIEYCTIKNLPSIILLADFEKAFDSVKWSFLTQILGFYGFGQNFRKWISILYKDSESCVTNNGYLSSFFKLSKGIRQGCPISALLFLLIAEIVAIVLRSSERIHGINVNGKNIKFCQLADDLTLFLSNTPSVLSAIEIFEEFYRYAGLKLNKSKTIAFLLKTDQEKVYQDDNIGIQWTSKPFKTLGAWFSPDIGESSQLNIQGKMITIKKILNSWSARCLTLKGKITVIKSLVIPHILQLASIVTFSHNLISDIDKILFEFIWKKKHLVSKNTLQLSYDLGGLKMVSINHIVETAKIMWVKRFFSEINASWKILASELMGLGKHVLLKKQSFNSIKNNVKTIFYYDLLRIWFQFLMKNLKNVDNVLHEPIFNNPHFLVGNHPLSSQNVKNPVLKCFTVQDIWDSDHDTFRSRNYIENFYNISLPYMLYNQVVRSVSSVMKLINKCGNNITLERCCNIPDKCLSNISQIKSSEVYSYFLALEYKTPKSQEKWIENYPFLESLDWKPVYLLPNLILNDAYLITFQYKILHRVFACNYNLFKWNIKNSPLCDICQKIDNLEHYFYYCIDTNVFWVQVKSWLNQLLSIELSLTVLEIFFGVLKLDPKDWYTVNFVILIGKKFISKCKKNNKELFFNNFLEYLNWMLSLEEGVYIRQGKSTAFSARYSLLQAHFF